MPDTEKLEEGRKKLDSRGKALLDTLTFRIMSLTSYLLLLLSNFFIGLLKLAQILD